MRSANLRCRNSRHVILPVMPRPAACAALWQFMSVEGRPRTVNAGMGGVSI
jgi:hypothetical protein